MEAIHKTEKELKRMLVDYLKKTIPLLESYTILHIVTGSAEGRYEEMPFGIQYSADPKKVEFVVERSKNPLRKPPISYEPEKFVEEVGLGVVIKVAESLENKVKVPQCPEGLTSGSEQHT